MPRNGAGTYTLPAGNPVEANTVITADWGNTTMEDLGNEITNSLSREGDGGMNAPLRFVDGDQNAPGISWVSETNTGFYYLGAGEFWVSVLGTNIVQFTANGVLIPTGIDLIVQGDVELNGNIQVDGNLTVDGTIFGDVTGNVTGNLAGNVTAASGTSTFTNVTVNTGMDMTNGIIANVATPIASADAANKAYVDLVAGGVSSVAMTAPAVFTVGGSPITSTGTLALTYSGTALPEVNGGTAQTTYTTGDLLYASGSNTLSKLAVGTSGQVLKVAAGVPSWDTDSAGLGTVTSVAQSFTGGLISVAGSPITTSGTLALTVAGNSGGIPYFSAASTWASSAALTQYGVVYGGGAGASPVATANGTTGQVLTATTSGAPTWAALPNPTVPAGAIIYTANNFGGF